MDRAEGSSTDHVMFPPTIFHFGSLHAKHTNQEILKHNVDEKDRVLHLIIKDNNSPQMKDEPEQFDFTDIDENGRGDAYNRWIMGTPVNDKERERTARNHFLGRSKISHDTDGSKRLTTSITAIRRKGDIGSLHYGRRQAVAGIFNGIPIEADGEIPDMGPTDNTVKLPDNYTQYITFTEQEREWGSYLFRHEPAPQEQFAKRVAGRRTTYAKGPGEGSTECTTEGRPHFHLIIESRDGHDPAINNADFNEMLLRLSLVGLDYKIISFTRFWEIPNLIRYLNKPDSGYTPIACNSMWLGKEVQRVNKGDDQSFTQWRPESAGQVHLPGSPGAQAKKDARRKFWANKRWSAKGKQKVLASTRALLHTE